MVKQVPDNPLRVASRALYKTLYRKTSHSSWMMTMMHAQTHRIEAMVEERSSTLLGEDQIVQVMIYLLEEQV